jgi:hypothetical protein
VPWLAALVEHHLEAERRWHIERRVVTVLGKAPLAGRDERAGEKVPVRIVFEEVRGHRCGLTGLRHKRHHGIGILARDVDATIVAQLHVEGVHHRRDLLGLREHLLESEGVAVPVVERNVAILAPSVRDVEVVADQCEAARNVQRVCGRRWIQEQRMRLARGAVVLEDADVVDAVPRFTPIADPPHSSVLRTRRCIGQNGRAITCGFSANRQAAAKITTRATRRACRHYKPVGTLHSIAAARSKS